MSFLPSARSLPHRLAVFFALACLGAGCTSYNPPRNGAADGIYYRKNGAMLPTVGVTDFENKASFSGQWNLGGGVADLLVNKLVESKRVDVLERQKINDVVGEIVRQGQDLFRKEGRVERGRLKNAQFLIRGSVTDFTVTGDSSGWFGVQDAGGIFGRRQRARVALTLYVSDVSSGEIISSVQTEGEVSAGGVGVAANYKNMSFGGDAYFRTPLGKATDIALERAVKKILKDLPVHSWQARVAEVEGGSVIINGGKNAGVRVGEIFYVREPPRSVTDPVTGNVIEKLPGKLTGKLEVKVVNDASSHTSLVQGTAKRGDWLEPMSKR